MQMKQIATTFIVGCILVGLGIRPDPLYVLKHGISYFRDRLSPFPGSVRRANDDGKQLAERIWLIAGGVALILISLRAYISD